MSRGTVSFPYSPGKVLPPGVTLAEWLDRRGMSQARFARRAGLSAKHVNQVLSGSVGLTAEVAQRFENVTEIPARYWMELESGFREYRLQTDEEAELTENLGLLGVFPIGKLIERGEMRRAVSRTGQLRELLRFFGVGNVQALQDVWLRPVAYRTSKAFKSDTAALAAWLRIAERQAERLATKPFDAKGCRALVQKLRPATGKELPVATDLLRRRCAQVGVAVTLVRELPGCRVNGAARWLSPEKAMIALSLRHRRNDIFWFTFFHEVAHIVRHSKKETFVDAHGSEVHGDLEDDADRFARRMLIPPQYESELKNLRTERDVVMFAKRIGVAPGVVLGRLQHEGHVAPGRFHHLFVPYRFPDED